MLARYAPRGKVSSIAHQGPSYSAPMIKPPVQHSVKRLQQASSSLTQRPLTRRAPALPIRTPLVVPVWQPSVLTSLSSFSVAHTPIRLFSASDVIKPNTEEINFASANGLAWIKEMQDAEKINFRMQLDHRFELKEGDVVVGFRVRRPDKKYAHTDIFYTMNPAIFSEPQFDKHWQALCDELLVPTQINRQSSIDLFTVTTTHQVWANTLNTKWGNVTQLLIGLDFVAHEYLLKDLLNENETDDYLHAHPERFLVRAPNGALVPPIFNPTPTPK
jgi:hypothetical protein